VHSDGPPYALFAFAGLAPLDLLLQLGHEIRATASLPASNWCVACLFPTRFSSPWAQLGALLLDLFLSLLVLGGLMIYYRWALFRQRAAAAHFSDGHGHGRPPVSVFAFSAFERPVFETSSTWFPFLLQMGMFVTPVIYPVRYVPTRWQTLFGLNPMFWHGIGVFAIACWAVRCTGLLF